MGITNKGPKFFVLCRRKGDFPATRTFSSPETFLMEQGLKDIDRHGSYGNVEEVAYCPSLSLQSGVFKLYISSGKKDGGNRPTINLKKLNNFLPNQHFKPESLYCLKVLL